MATVNADPPVLTATQMLRHGLLLLQVDDQMQASRQRSTNVGVFKKHFGPHPLHAARVWAEMLTCQVSCPAAFVTPAQANVNGFFYALHFLRSYPVNEDNAATRWRICAQTLRKKVWFFVEKLAALAELKIAMPTANEWLTTFIVSVDGTHFQLQEPRDPNVRRNRTNYSHKFHSAGVNYEVAVALFMQKIVWINGPMKASVNDTTAFKASLMAEIPHGKRVIVDNGYEGLPDTFSNYNQFDTPEMKEFKRRAKSRQESVNSRMAVYNCLADRFRHKRAKHGICFRAVAVLVVDELASY